MKRIEFIRFLNAHNCILYREGANHSIFKNIENNFNTSIPRHIELKNNTCKEICKQLNIPNPF
jgi:mRNA interferase HicA